MKLKCPVCESVIRFDNTDTKIKCQLCESVFKKDKILAIYQSRALLKSTPETQKPSPTEPGNAPARKKAKVENAVISDSKKSATTKIGLLASPVNSDTDISEITSATVVHKAKKTKRTLYLILGFCLASLLLTIAIIWVIQSNSTTTATNEAVGSNELAGDSQADFDNASVSPQNHRKAIPTAAKKTPVSPPVRKPFAVLDLQTGAKQPFTKPTNLFKAKKALDRCWFNVKPYLLELYADTSTGGKTATGIIVDSRGWVATSYNAFKGATEIHVRRAVDKNQTDDQRVVDKVRGVVAAMPKHDLVLLSINRRLIDTFEDLPISSEDKNLVASQYTIQAQPPSKLYPYQIEETQIRQTATNSQLESSIAKRLEFREFDPQVRWLIHENLAPLKIGAPLLSDLGDVLAMNTAAFDAMTKKTVALPAKYIVELKNGAADEVLSLPFGGNAAAPNSFANAPVSTPVVAVDADNRTLSEDLNRLGEQCQSFSWWPETDTEKNEFRQFIELLVQAKEKVDDANGSDDEIETLTEQIEKWRQQLANNLGGNRSPTSVAQNNFNQEFANISEPGKPFAAFVFISHAAINLEQIALGNSSQPAAAVGLEFKGLSKKMIANIDPSWPPMPVDSPWLIIGKEIPGVVKLKDPNGFQETLREGEIHFVLDSNAP